MALRFLFVDFNAYFASVEQQMRPELRGKPVVVAPMMTDSTCAIAASYEAKRFGIKTGTGIREAKALCRELIVVEARHHEYIDYHHRLVEAVESCVPVHSVLSIDEMACTLTGSQQQREQAVALAKQVNIVIVYVHWGSSMSPHVHDFQREIGKAAIDAGAHAVFGGHQHVLSAIEFHKGCPIVHCSGNLLFDKWEHFFTAETLKTFLFGATVEAGGLRDCYLLPVKNGVGTPPRLLSRHDPLWQEIFDDLQAQCSAFGTQLVAREDAVEIRAG